MSETENSLSSPTQSKGGLKYDLVLEKPSNDPPKLIATRPVESPAKQLSAEDIANKLKEAEERRKSIEAQKISHAKERMSHVSELKDKRSEIEEQKIESTRQTLEKKMEASKENRETLIKAIQEKQKEHVTRVEAKRRLSNESLLMPAKDKLNNIKAKMASAAESREAKITALQDRLREHDRHVDEVRKGMEGSQHSNDLLKTKLDYKLTNAEKNRQLIVKEIQERLKEHGEKVAEVVKRKSEVVPGSGDAVE